MGLKFFLKSQTLTYLGEVNFACCFLQYFIVTTSYTLLASMISSIVWVPAGVADPSPKKYEYSQAEIDLINMMENHDITNSEKSVIIENGTNKEGKKDKKKKHSIEHDLPADLRMDEYSSDEDDNGAVSGAAIGKLLVEVSEGIESNVGVSEKFSNNIVDSDENDRSNNDSDGDGDIDDDDNVDDDDDDDDDDDLADVPDTREFMPIDIDGLNAIGSFSHVGANIMNDDDDDEDIGSDAEDVLLRSTDAIMVVAKTEDVSCKSELMFSLNVKEWSYESDCGRVVAYNCQ